MPFRIVRNDITKMNTQAIVNTANAGMAVGAGCDSAVYKAAGYEELMAWRKEKIGEVPEGEVFLTPGFHLQAEYIIHAVSPLYRGGGEREEKKLRSCYRKSLELAKKHQIRSIAFPLIATGSFGYPKEEGMRIAADEINAFLLENEMEIVLVVFDDRAVSLGEKLYPDLEEYIDRNYVEEMHAAEYGMRGSSVRESEAPYERRRSGRDFLSGSVLRNVRKPFAASQEAQASEKKAEKEEDYGAASVFESVQCNDAADYSEFEEVHESRLEERMKHLSDTFSQYLLYLIRLKNMENSEVYKRAIVDKKTFSKIKNNKNYHPQKLTALCLCVGAKLNLDESRDLLARAGYALSPCDKTDIIFSYFIENRIYDMIELDIQLEEHGLPCIIS